MDRETFISYVERLNPHTVFAPLGIRVHSYDPEAFAVALDIDERHYQHMGIVHGGIYALLAESAASMAAAMSLDMTKHTIAGVDLNATHLKVKRNGTIVATARPIFRGRSTHVYGIEISDGEGDLVCVSRCTLAVRPRKVSS
ncbi:MAG: PaaI family thioesterase [Acidobacteriota bacterium]